MGYKVCRAVAARWGAGEPSTRAQCTLTMHVLQQRNPGCMHRTHCIKQASHASLVCCWLPVLLLDCTSLQSHTTHMLLQVMMARKKFEVPYPHLHADKVMCKRFQIHRLADGMTAS